MRRNYSIISHLIKVPEIEIPHQFDASWRRQMSFANQTLAGSARRLGRFPTVASRLLRRFDADQGGNVAISAAVVLPILVGAIGMGVSYSMGNSTRNDMQNALDASVLAGVIASNSG